MRQDFVDPATRLRKPAAEPEEECEVPDDLCGDLRCVLETEVHRRADVVIVLGNPICPFVLIRPAAEVRIGSSHERGERIGVAPLELEP